MYASGSPPKSHRGLRCIPTPLRSALPLTVGAMHSSCISDSSRGAVAWCDSDVTAASHSDRCSAGTGWLEYCSPHSLMGAGDITKPFYMSGAM